MSENTQSAGQLENAVAPVANPLTAEQEADAILAAHAEAMQAKPDAHPFDEVPTFSDAPSYADAKKSMEHAIKRADTERRRHELVFLTGALIQTGHASPKTPNDTVMLARKMLAAVDLAMLDGEGGAA